MCCPKPSGSKRTDPPPNQRFETDRRKRALRAQILVAAAPRRRLKRDVRHLKDGEFSRGER